MMAASANAGSGLASPRAFSYAGATVAAPGEFSPVLGLLLGAGRMEEEGTLAFDLDRTAGVG
jgi:hypothetical protein